MVDEAESSGTLVEYFSALERLVNGNARVLPFGAKINNDAVALEAGRAKGSIKKSRKLYALLIMAIHEAAAKQARPKMESKKYVDKLKMEMKGYIQERDAALIREVSLYKELLEVRQELNSIKGGEILPLRRKF